MGIIFTAIFSGIEVIWDKQFGFLKETLVAPVSRTKIMLGRTLGGATVATLQGILVFIISLIIGFRPESVLAVLGALIIMFLVAIVFTALGTAIASMLDDMQGFQLIMNFLVMPLFFLSGALFPLRGLPGWMSALTRLDPASYGIDPLRRVVLNAAAAPNLFGGAPGMTIGGRVLPIAVELVVLTAFAVLMLAIAIRNFRVPD